MLLLPDFIELDQKKKKQLIILQTFQRKKREFQIKWLILHSVIRLEDAILPLLDKKNRKEAILCSKFANQSSIAYRKMARLPGAMRFCDFRISKALEILGRGD